MKFSCLQVHLNQSLQHVNKIVSSRPTLPVLSNVLLKTDEGRLKLATTNLEIGVTHWIGAQIEKEGAFTVPAKLLTDIVSSLPNEKVEIELKSNQLMISCGKFKTQLNGIDSDEFPEPPKLSTPQTVEMPAHIFKKYIPSVLFAAANDESRPIITGIYTILDHNEIVFVSADGYRLAECTISLDSDISVVRTSIVIPSKTMAELVRILPDTQKSTVKLEYDANQILFTYEDVQLFSRLLEGQFPDYKQIIPKSTKNTAIVDKEELEKAVRISSLFSENTTSVIHLSIDETTQALTTKAASAQIGENEAALTAEVKGEGKISFNARYILDVTSNLGEEKLKVGINDELSPGVITPVVEASKTKTPSYTYVVMPIRT